VQQTLVINVGGYITCDLLKVAFQFIVSFKLKVFRIRRGSDPTFYILREENLVKQNNAELLNMNLPQF